MLMDLHTHSIWSDGSQTPEGIVRLAKEAELSLIALTDHDTMAGVPQAQEAGAREGVAVLSAIEIDIEHTNELHMLAYGLDTMYQPLLERLAQVEAARDVRNQKIIARLAELGAPVSVGRTEGGSIPNRTHIAKALVDAGFAGTNREAFATYLGPQGSARFEHSRMSAREALALIKEAGGLSVMAHPGQYKGNLTQTVSELAELGLWGIEAYYPAHTQGQIEQFRSLASRFGLFVTCGSDFHGTFRPHVPLGAVSKAAEADPMVQKTAALLYAYRK